MPMPPDNRSFNKNGKNKPKSVRNNAKIDGNHLSYRLQTFSDLPTSRPNTPLLDTINHPADLKPLDDAQLRQLCDELRAFLLYSVGQSGGHFGANLGVVELTVALHSVLDTPTDKLVWDVGHQAYAHKILTGRRQMLSSIRAKGGLTAFPERAESEFDAFGVGHSSTAISALLGMSLAARLTGEPIKAVCVVGDGAMTGGMAFEAMNDAVQQNGDLLVVLNDNDMSISQATGGFSKHLAALWRHQLVVDIDESGKPIIAHRELAHDDRRLRHYLHLANEALGDLSARLPAKIAQKVAQKMTQGELPTARDWVRLPEKLAGKIADNVFPDNLFRAIGFAYFGPFDGHDVVKLKEVLTRAQQLKGAVLIHVHTVKGKGFDKAELDPIGYHALAKQIPPHIDNLNKDGDDGKNSGNQANAAATPLPNELINKPLKYSDVFGKFLLDTAKTDTKLVAITPAMAEGSGMVGFARAHPKRFFDVAIAEQHAVTLAAGMATNPNIKPIVAIYSTFLQRAYDQVIHDVALQNLDVTFAIDRAGLVGEDGATHAGVFDLAFLRCVPNIIIATPSDENLCYHALKTCYEHNGAAAVRYPRGVGVGAQIVPLAKNVYPIGKSKIMLDFMAIDDDPVNALHNNATPIAFLNFGARLAAVMAAARRLQTAGVNVAVLDMRWVKPLDIEALEMLWQQGLRHFITVEEHQIIGGAGSAVNEFFATRAASIKNLGIADRFIAHASADEQLTECGLDEQGIYERALAFINACR